MRKHNFGCRGGMQDAGHRRWDADAGQGMWKQDLGCRDGMEVQDKGCSSPGASRCRPCPGMSRHPRRWGARATSREMQISKEKKIIAIESHTGILQLVPHLGGRARLRGHICPPDVSGRRFGKGNGAPADGETSWLHPCAGWIGNAALAYHTCSGETPGWDQE